MSRAARIAVMGAVVLCSLMSLVGVASASTGIASPGLSSSVTGPVTLTSSGVNIICSVTLTGNLERTIAKTAGALGLTATGGTIFGCNPSTVTGTVVPGITVGYRSFAGTLPGITGFTGTNTSVGSFTLRGTPFPAAGCTFSAAIGAFSLTTTGSANTFTNASMSGAVTSRSSGCPVAGTLNGRGTFALTVVVTLV
jgi:hypothetical protein